jgi:hypothetical protein
VQKIRCVLYKALMYAIGIYVVSVQVMTCYYWWRDVKAHDGFVRAVIWSPVVGLFKATHWPYYAFIQGGGTEQAEKPSISHLRQSLAWYGSAYGLIASLPSSRDCAKDRESIVSLMQEAQAEAKKIDKDELNSLNPGLGDAVAENYLPALEYYRTALTEPGRESDAFRADAAMARFSTWIKENMEEGP